MCERTLRDICNGNKSEQQMMENGCSMLLRTIGGLVRSGLSNGGRRGVRALSVQTGGDGKEDHGKVGRRDTVSEWSGFYSRRTWIRRKFSTRKFWRLSMMLQMNWEEIKRRRKGNLIGVIYTSFRLMKLLLLDTYFSLRTSLLSRLISHEKETFQSATVDHTVWFISFVFCGIGTI